LDARSDPSRVVVAVAKVATGVAYVTGHSLHVNGGLALLI